jgi:EAL domain-containing protein (putative c-di-GMP-specific phosphodiesterase class I)
VYIEITESVPFSHYERCVQVLTELRTRASVHLVIDDLGSGFSNLMRIVELQPKIVKLDMALVRNVNKHPRQLALVRSIVQMCAAQGAAVVAEGIETADELVAIIATGCAYGQGYVLGRPAFPPPPVEWPLK